MVELKVEWEKPIEMHIQGRRCDTLREQLLAGAIIVIHLMKLTDDLDIALDLIKATYRDIEKAGYESYLVDGGAIGANPEN